MKRAEFLTSVGAFAFAAMAAFIFPAGASPQDSTLDAQIAHGASGCEGGTPGKTSFGFIPPGFDYRFTVTSAATVQSVLEAHVKFAGYWEKSFRRSAVSGADAGELKRELRLAGSVGAAWLLAGESQIDEFLKVYQSGKPVTYEVALLGCTNGAGSVDAIMGLKDFEID